MTGKSILLISVVLAGMSGATAGAAAAGADNASGTLASTPPGVDTGAISGLGARNIGSATMSGRISALAGYNDPSGKLTLFVGAASGGVWKSMDGGTTFKPVFDEQPVQSIGAIALDPSNPKNVWVGTGEPWTRNSVSVGDGIYKSIDAGETWTHAGLPQSERISKIIVDPRAADTVYACVPGKLWGDSADRGLYKTTDGGKQWVRVLKGGNLSTGCGSIAMDPNNPDVLFASLWDFRRKGWSFRSGGDGPKAAVRERAVPDCRRWKNVERIERSSQQGSAGKAVWPDRRGRSTEQRQNGLCLHRVDRLEIADFA